MTFTCKVLRRTCQYARTFILDRAQDGAQNGLRPPPASSGVLGFPRLRKEISSRFYGHCQLAAEPTMPLRKSHINAQSGAGPEVKLLVAKVSNDR